MPRSCYVIEQHQSHWVISVCGAMVMTCKTKRAALKAARRAMVLLHQSQQVEILGSAPPYFHDGGLRRAGTVPQSEPHERRNAPAKAAGTRRG
jgi:hypothetical protein